MNNHNNKNQQRDQIWSYIPKEKQINLDLHAALSDRGFVPSDQFPPELNYGQPYIFHRGETYASIRFIDSVFLTDPEAWTRPAPSMIITDNILLAPSAGNVISGVPEHWGVFYNQIKHSDTPAMHTYNCLMNRISGERSIVFYELIRRNILDKGLVSFNAWLPGQREDYSQQNYDKVYQETELQRYQIEHEQGRSLVPYNTVGDYEDQIENVIMASKVSIILETFVSDSHIVFSEKLFRCLQMPRPWVLFCSPQSVFWLRHYGFDVLDDYVDHNSYDSIVLHFERLGSILDQVETFVDRQYTQSDYDRFEQAAAHNQQLLKRFEDSWNDRFQFILQQLKNA